jgi:hypothetical protein
MRLGRIAVTAIALTTLPRVTKADVTQARAFVAEAEQLVTAGKYVDAAAKFRAAHALDPRPEYLCNVGVAYHRARELTRAHIYLSDCLVRGTTLDPKFVALVRDAVAAVEEKLRAGEFTPVDIVVSPPSAAIQIRGFDAEEKLVGARVVWLSFGNHVITASADGYASETRSIEAITRSQREVRFDLRRAAQPEQPASPREPPSPRRDQPARSKLPATVATAATGAVALVALGAFVMARTTMADAGSTTITYPEYLAIVDRAETYKHVSWAVTGLAGAGALVSGYLWYRAMQQPVSVEVAPTTTGASVQLRVTW